MSTPEVMDPHKSAKEKRESNRELGTANNEMIFGSGATLNDSMRDSSVMNNSMDHFKFQAEENNKRNTETKDAESKMTREML